MNGIEYLDFGICQIPKWIFFETDFMTSSSYFKNYCPKLAFSWMLHNKRHYHPFISPQNCQANWLCQAEWVSSARAQWHETITPLECHFPRALLLIREAGDAFLQLVNMARFFFPIHCWLITYMLYMGFSQVSLKQTNRTSLNKNNNNKSR